MIKITNGARTTMCTKGAFENWYKPMGWEEVKPKNKPIEKEEENPEPKGRVEVPLSELNLEELKAYAEENNIDISQAKTKKEIRNLIKSSREG